MSESAADETPMEQQQDEDVTLEVARLAELGLLTASLLHELRQPLFAIKAHAQLLQVEGGGDLQRLGRILDQVGHMEALLGGFGDLGRVEPEEELFDLNAPVRSAIEMLAHRRRMAALEADLAPCHLPVRGREVAARQVTLNLLQNAYDAVEGMSGHRVVVRTRSVGDRVRLEVEDSGPGVPDHLRVRVFEPFVTTKPRGRGTGLGLYIVRRLVDEAQGELRLTTPRDGGTRFEVDLPRAA